MLFGEGEFVKNINIHVVFAVALLWPNLANAEFIGDFLGGYYGGKVGVNHSRSTGAINSPSESTLAYLVQGGYLQAGYNLKFGEIVLGGGGYVDLHGYERHSNDIIYGSHSLGADFKVALPFGYWLPYVKIGYGFSQGTNDLDSVMNYGFNKTAGFEYKFTPQWSWVAEYKINRFQSNDTAIENKTFMLGLNYFLNKPVPPEAVEIEYEPLPVIEEAPPEFAPPP